MRNETIKQIEGNVTYGTSILSFFCPETSISYTITIEGEDVYTNTFDASEKDIMIKDLREKTVLLRRAYKVAGIYLNLHWNL